MKVTIINKTQNAEELLIFTKNTRLNMSASMMEEIRNWPEERKAAELDYMASTIKSSWEFVDVVFLIEGVTRATAQQITRTRNASYAMQSQRVVDARDIPVTNPIPADKIIEHNLYEDAIWAAKSFYTRLADNGVPLEDARGVLPINTQCNLVAKYNLRALTDVVKARKSLRAQGEYASIARKMEEAVIEVWPWTAAFFKGDNDIAIAMLEEVAKNIGITTGKGDGWQIAKAIDLLRK